MAERDSQPIREREDLGQIPAFGLSNVPLALSGEAPGSLLTENPLSASNDKVQEAVRVEES
jgi:hypothetical protein